MIIELNSSLLGSGDIIKVDRDAGAMEKWSDSIISAMVGR